MADQDLRDDPGTTGPQGAGTGAGTGDDRLAGTGGRPSTDQIARGDGVRDGGRAVEPSDGAGADHRVGDERGSGSRTPLFPAEQAKSLRSRWESIQVGFVDEPRAAVEQADSLVAETMQTLATTFSHERSGLEGQWSKGEDVSTEDLRQTLQRYRSFFDRLLSL